MPSAGSLRTVGDGTYLLQHLDGGTDYSMHTMHVPLFYRLLLRHCCGICWTRAVGEWFAVNSASPRHALPLRISALPAAPPVLLPGGFGGHSRLGTGCFNVDRVGRTVGRVVVLLQTLDGGLGWLLNISFLSIHCTFLRAHLCPHDAHGSNVDAT